MSVVLDLRLLSWILNTVMKTKKMKLYNPYKLQVNVTVLYRGTSERLGANMASLLQP